MHLAIQVVFRVFLSLALRRPRLPSADYTDIAAALFPGIAGSKAGLTWRRWFGPHAE
jgi:hypothetical protein